MIVCIIIIAYDTQPVRFVRHGSTQTTVMCIQTDLGPALTLFSNRSIGWCSSSLAAAVMFSATNVWLLHACSLNYGTCINKILHVDWAYSLRSEVKFTRVQNFSSFVTDFFSSYCDAELLKVQVLCLSVCLSLSPPLSLSLSVTLCQNVERGMNDIAEPSMLRTYITLHCVTVPCKNAAGLL